MRKLAVMVFIGGLILTSCTEKESSTESNRMLEEPEVTSIDSTQTVTTPTATSTVDPVATDSAASR